MARPIALAALAVADQPLLLHHLQQAEDGGIRQRTAVEIDLFIDLADRGLLLPQHLERFQLAIGGNRFHHGLLPWLFCIYCLIG